MKRTSILRTWLVILFSVLAATPFEAFRGTQIDKRKMDPLTHFKFEFNNEILKIFFLGGGGGDILLLGRWRYPPQKNFKTFPGP